MNKIGRNLKVLERIVSKILININYLLKKKKFLVSVPIYILGPNKKEHGKFFRNLKNQQLAPNIYYLGKIIFLSNVKQTQLHNLTVNSCKN